MSIPPPLYATLDKNNAENNQNRYQSPKSYPKFTNRFKTHYAKDFKAKKPMSNQCYNPNIRVHTKKQYPMDAISTNAVITLCSSILKSMIAIRQSLLKKDPAQLRECSVAHPATRYCLYNDKNSYIDWRIQSIYHFKRPVDFMPSMPFKATSTYTKTFLPPDLTCRGTKLSPKLYDYNRRHPKIENPICYFDSTNKVEFKGVASPVERATRQHEHLEAFYFPGQFVTESKRSYTIRNLGPSTPTQMQRPHNRQLFNYS